MKGPKLEAIQTAKIALDIAKVSVADAKEALEHIDGHSNTGLNSRASRPNSRRDYSKMVNPTTNQANSQDDPKEVARKNLQNAIDDVTSKESVYNSCVQDLQAFRSSNLTTVDEFVQHGKNSVNGLFLDFKRLFIAQNGNYRSIISAYTTAEVLNPIAAVSMSVLEISNAMKNLGKDFGFDEFREGHGIIDDMILEIDSYKAIATYANDEFWNNLDGSSKYDEKLATRIRNGTIGDDVTWKDDPIESARRVWEFWRVHRKNVKIFHIAKAARLIALVQVSSASVERIFSQMKLIRDSCGDNMLEETLFGRVCERCNTYEVLQKRGRD
jgi:hypothetical protein